MEEKEHFQRNTIEETLIKGHSRNPTYWAKNNGNPLCQAQWLMLLEVA